MDEQRLIFELNRLYEEYEVDKKNIQRIPKDQIIRGVKGILAVLEQEKNGEYTKADLEIIKDIYFYYG